MTAALDHDLLRSVEQFVYREARLCDERRYDDWESLWTDDGVYWVPANGDDIDPTIQMSIVFDNRARIATRVAQLNTGKRHAQSPPSRLARIIANVELTDGTDGQAAGDTAVAANFVLYESRGRGLTPWAGRIRYRLRIVEGEWRMAAKSVFLVDNDQPLSTLAFLI